MNPELQERIKRAAQSLIESGAHEVFLFGSMATGTMREGSDIDLAVTGLPDEVFFRAMARAGDILQHPLDLVHLDDDTPFTRHLKEEGLLVRVA